ncbi:membrane dipeptidase [Streptomyces sp. NPDC050264]|uniref:membrane dipeptidase n=1 Tax=Streptomyces sp. NPDC050264 TaxID=3155038 RepID=UPI003444D1FA
MNIDGLECGVFNRTVFEELRGGRVDCVTNTIAFWENAAETMQALADWYGMERHNADLIRIAYSTADIEAAAAEGRTAVLMGTQNASPIEDRLDYIELFARMGLRVMQLTYNIQNTLGASCYETTDAGLTRFGRNAVEEMNRCGILVDCSHVGDRTSYDAIHASAVPVAVNHANPREFFDHARNKRPEVIDALAERGGVLGLTMYPNIAGEWCETVESWCELVARTVERIGVDHVGVGSDLGRFLTEEHMVEMRKGHWTRGPEYGAGKPGQSPVVPDPEWFETAAQFGNIPDGLAKAGFCSAEVEKLCGGNWLRLYRQTIDVNLQGGPPAVPVTASA